jgi:hypothetical protein
MLPQVTASTNLSLPSAAASSSATNSSASSSATAPAISHVTGPGIRGIRSTGPNTMPAIRPWQPPGTPAPEFQGFFPLTYHFTSAILVPAGWTDVEHGVAWDALVAMSQIQISPDPASQASVFPDGFTRGTYYTWSRGTSPPNSADVRVEVAIATQTGTVMNARITHPNFVSPIVVNFVDIDPRFLHASHDQSTIAPRAPSTTTTVHAGTLPMAGTLNQHAHARSLPSWANALPDPIRTMIQSALTSSSLPLYMSRSPSAAYLIATVRDPSSGDGAHATLHFLEKTDEVGNDGVANKSLELVKIRATWTNPDNSAVTTTTVQAPGYTEIRQQQQQQQSFAGPSTISSISLQDTGHSPPSTEAILLGRRRRESVSTESGDSSKRLKNNEDTRAALDKGKGKASPPTTVASTVDLSGFGGLDIDRPDEDLTFSVAQDLFDISLPIDQAKFELPPDSDEWRWNNLIHDLDQLDGADRQAMIDYYRANKRLDLLPDDGRLATPMAFHKYLNTFRKTSFQDAIAVLDTPLGRPKIQTFLETSFPSGKNSERSERRCQLALFLDHLCETAPVKPKAWEGPAWLGPNAAWGRLLGDYYDQRAISESDKTALAKYARQLWLGGQQEGVIKTSVSGVRLVLESSRPGFLDELCKKLSNASSEKVLRKIVENELPKKTCTKPQRSHILQAVRYMTNDAGPGRSIKWLGQQQNRDDVRAAAAFWRRISAASSTGGNAPIARQVTEWGIELVARLMESGASGAKPILRDKALQSNQKWLEFLPESIKAPNNSENLSRSRMLHSYLHITAFAERRESTIAPALARKYLEEWMIFRISTKASAVHDLKEHNPEGSKYQARWNLAEFANDVTAATWATEVDACEKYCRDNNRLTETELAELKTTLNAFRAWEQQLNEPPGEAGPSSASNG